MLAWAVASVVAFVLTIAATFVGLQEDSKVDTGTRVALALWASMLVGVTAFFLTQPKRESGRIFGPFYARSPTLPVATPRAVFDPTKPNPLV